MVEKQCWFPMSEIALKQNYLTWRNVETKYLIQTKYFHQTTDGKNIHKKSPLASRYLIHIFLFKKKKTETITISFDLNQITNFIYETGVEWALILKFHIFGRYMDFYFIVINGSNPTIKSISCILMLFWYNNKKIIVSTEH